MTQKVSSFAKKTMSSLRFRSVAFIPVMFFVSTIAAFVPQANAQFTFGPLTLRRTYLQGQPNTITASCSTVGCTATPVAIFVPVLNAVCPKPANQFCDLYIHIETHDTRLTRNDAGLFRFWVDNAPAAPGPVDANGFFTWDNNDPNSNFVAPFSHSYAVVAHVLNSEANQAHSVEVDVSCTELSGNNACTAATGFATLEVNVY